MFEKFFLATIVTFSLSLFLQLNESATTSQLLENKITQASDSIIVSSVP